MKVGDRVRVKESVTVYHYPQKVHQPIDIQGFEGEVVAIATEWHGKPISANLPVCVKFDVNGKPLRTHLREDEIEALG